VLSILVLAHILFGKPVPTFPGYALAQMVIPGRRQRVRAKRGPMTGSAPDPESMTTIGAIRT